MVPGGGRQFPQQKLDEGGLSGTAVTHDKNKLSLFYPQVHSVQSRSARRIALAYPVKNYDGAVILNSPFCLPRTKKSQNLHLAIPAA